jgi:hypothetical protein
MTTLTPDDRDRLIRYGSELLELRVPCACRDNHGTIRPAVLRPPPSSRRGRPSSRTTALDSQRYISHGARRGG